MRLIDVDEMVDILTKAALLEEDSAMKQIDIIGVQFIERVINDYARIRAREFGSAEDIVRCKDCKHRPVMVWNEAYGDFDVLAPEADGKEDWRCPCLVEDDPYYSWSPNDNWFCGNGERSGKQC